MADSVNEEKYIGCGYITAHTAGVPCSSVKCPNCAPLLV